jgi:hypothetical protein
VFKSIGNRFQPTVNLELMEDILNVVSRRGRTDGEQPGNVTGAETLRQEGQNLAFASCKVFGEGFC